MCFKNLPIAFDKDGNAYLKEGVKDPYEYKVVDLGIEQDKLKDLMVKNGFIRSVDYDPVTRVAGALAFHSVVDLEKKKVDVGGWGDAKQAYDILNKCIERYENSEHKKNGDFTI